MCIFERRLFFRYFWFFIIIVRGNVWYFYIFNLKVVWVLNLIKFVRLVIFVKCVYLMYCYVICWFCGSLRKKMFFYFLYLFRWLYFLKKVWSEVFRKIYLCFNKEDENIEVYCYNVFNFILVICDILFYELYCV